MKNFMQIHDITQNVQGRLKYMAVAKIQLPCPSKDIEGKLYVDETSSTVWVYNDNGWNNASEAVEFAFNLLLHNTVPPVYGEPQTQAPRRVYEEPQKSERSRPVTLESIQEQRKKQWYEPPKTMYKNAFETMYDIPKRTYVPTDTVIEDNSEAPTGSLRLREPANKGLMEQLKRCITPYRV